MSHKGSDYLPNVNRGIYDPNRFTEDRNGRFVPAMYSTTSYYESTVNVVVGGVEA